MWIVVFHLLANPLVLKGLNFYLSERETGALCNVPGLKQSYVQNQVDQKNRIRQCLKPSCFRRLLPGEQDSRFVFMASFSNFLPLKQISSKWGELVELEDGYDDLFARKRICIKTSQTENILESFKLIVKGKVFWARAKELFVWSPSFKDVPEKELPLKDNIPEAESVRPPSRSARSNSRVLEEAENSVDRVSSESFSNGVKIKEGGSIWRLLKKDDYGGTNKWAFLNEGCTKDMEKHIELKENN
ncbi:hypothetical protein Tco_0827790 [Tanacetum coccineum]|uniref:RNA-directed DNA polymerase, eukaryota n=1 Tax=Tanacetum coccineum TaxID=301880 RepID=A0ABQ4XR60_9ASTR